MMIKLSAKIRELKDVLEQYGRPKEGLKVYVIPADVHN